MVSRFLRHADRTILNPARGTCLNIAVGDRNRAPGRGLKGKEREGSTMRCRPAAYLGAAVLSVLALGWGFVAPAAADEGDGMGGPAPAPKPAEPAPAAAAPAPPAPAPDQDVLVLKDGTEIHGRISAEDDQGYAVRVGGSLRVVDKSKVAEVRRAPKREGDGADDAAPGAREPGAAGKDGDRERKRDRKRGEGAPEPGSPPPPLTEDGRAWAKSCIERFQSADPAVQRSAAEALRALGPSALPLVREARDAATDEPSKMRLERAVAMLEKAPRPGADGKFPRPGDPKSPDGKPPESKPGEPKPGADAPKRGFGILERVKTELALDESQSRTVGQALLTYGREAREAMMDARDGLITYEEARTRGADLRTKLREGLKASLSAEQLDKLDVILDDMGKKLGGPKEKGPPKDGAPKDAPPKDPPPQK
jgi:hypothetical protein